MTELLQKVENGTVLLKYSHYRTGEPLSFKATTKHNGKVLKNRPESNVYAFYDLGEQEWKSIYKNTITEFIEVGSL